MATPCEPWLTRADVCGPGDDVSPTIASAAIASATSWLYEATCGRFTGVCTSTIRPRRLIDDGVCSVPESRRYRLDLSPWVAGPILSIAEVVVDGVTVDAGDYRLVNARWLVTHEGGALHPWPDQHPDRPDGDEGTWSVTVTHGRVPPPELLDAAADLAKQLIARCTGGDCLLPDNATSVSRDGVTVELNVPTDGKTGLPLIDTVVAMYPCRRTRRIYDPATPEAEVFSGG